MPATRRAFLGAAASLPAWSLPGTALHHDWTYRAPGTIYPPRVTENTLVTAVWGADSERAVGLDPGRGGERWTHPGAVGWQTGGVGDHVVVRTPERDALTGVNPASGAVAWTTTFGDQGETVVRETAVHPDAGTAYAVTDAGVVAVDIASGDERWRVADATGYAAGTAETAALETDGGLVGVRVTDGAERWRHENVAWTTAHDSLGRVVARRMGRLVAWDVDTGAVAWWRGTGSPVGAVDDRMLLRAANARGETEIVAVSPDGSVAWRYGVPDNAGVSATSDALLVFTDGSGESRTVTVVADGRARWQDEFEYAFGLATTSRGELRLPTADGVEARALRDGLVRWRYETPGRGVYAVERGGRAYVGAEAEDGESFELHAVRPPWGGLAAAARWGDRNLGVLGALGGLGAVGAAVAGVRWWRDRRRVEGHVETIERTDDWTTARVESGRVRTEYWNLDESGFRAACEAWRDASDTAGVLALREWGVEPRPWVETSAYAATLADLCERERGLRAVSSAADALSRLDRPHGFIRPASVVLDDGDSETARVRDVGFGALAADAWPNQDDAYAPPETEPTPAGDVYRLGALTHHALTGRPPENHGFADGALDRPVSDDLREVVETALAADPDDRYGTPRRFGEYLAWAAFAQETW
ncbi:outer membrane protein assembly factor BamB family protein [Salarchaeum japonicum]|uniref:outer membrane protein assembly factor BamB family protein n=1 Tax=Salarchaeum japonicum TaxID=555573 RepID=UPI001D0AC00C|nr:PQQ-binding-like beta-propeller repeat protein [Salarchaeum japonicum]